MWGFIGLLIILILLFGVDGMRSIVGGAFSLIVIFIAICAVIAFIGWLCDFDNKDVDKNKK